MRNLSLDQLRTLVEVIDLGSFSAAARQLNLTQPAVSLQIRELEQRFGVKLIERMGARVFATAPGNELHEHAHRIFAECDAANEAMRRYRDGWMGRVRIGTTNTGLMYHLPAIIRSLRQENPGLELMVTNVATRETVESVLNNRFDLGLVTLPVEEAQLRVTPLRPEMLVAILPADMPGIPDRVTPGYAASQPLVLEHARSAVYTLTMRWLAKHLPLSSTPMQVGTVESMKNIVELGLGISIVPDIAVVDAPPGIVVRAIDPPVACTMGLIEHRSKVADAAFGIVRNALLGLKVDTRDGAWDS
jgi:DNA-binding transcriptional LysR family regulator